jgi:type VI secretion system protein ImpH
MSAEDFFARLREKPYAHDFYFTLRKLESLFRDKPRTGTAARPQDEPVRMGQDVSLAFAPAAITAFETASASSPPRLLQRFFGFLGPNGALPTHLTEFTRERILHHGDRTIARFLDLFHHRFLSLFYRAWAQAQPTVSFDRPRDDRFADYVGSLVGVGSPALHGRDASGDHVKLYFSGWLNRQIRNPDGLASILRGYFQLPVRVENFVGHWMKLPESERTRLGLRSSGSQLGVGAVIGASVWDRQHKLRVHFGPLELAEYESLLPSGDGLPSLVSLLRQYLCFEYEWDARLSLKAEAVPRAQLGRFGRLGWTTWIGSYRSAAPADDLILDAERVTASVAS